MVPALGKPRGGGPDCPETCDEGLPNSSGRRLYDLAVLRRALLWCLGALAALATLGACGGASGEAADATPEPAATPTTASAPTPTVMPTAPPTPTPTPRVVEGTVVSAVDGRPLGSAAVLVEGTRVATTSSDGRFSVTVPAGVTEVHVERPVWGDLRVNLTEDNAPVEVRLEPVVVRGLRVSQQVVADDQAFDELLELAQGTTVNTLVFDTKDEEDLVLYETEVEFAHRIDAVAPVYDPAARLAQAHARGLYTVTRIVTFEDPVWARAAPEAGLAGHWVDAANPDNWAYPLALAEEACGLGFDEVQFDYVRFPSGETAARAADLVPATEEERVAAISGFLGAARELLHPMGCGVSAAIFGIVMSSETDERLGQTPEGISAVVDAVSPMVYPSHYGPGWLGFADPNDHPGPVVAHALETGGPRLAPSALMRPWIQGFYYNGSQVLAQIQEAEQRGAGWIIWNFFGEYRRDWLPSAS